MFHYIFKESISLILFIPSLLFLKRKLSKERYLFILNFHNFSKYYNYKIVRGNILETGYSKNFEKQIIFLKKHFKLCYPENFFSKNNDNGIYMFITFDDGYKDNYDIATPILKKYNIPTIFFITSQILNNDTYLKHDKIKYLVQNKFISKNYLMIQKKINLGLEYYKEKDIKKIEDIFIRENPNHRLMMNKEEVCKLYEYGFKIGNHTYAHDGLSFLNKVEQYKTVKISNKEIMDLIGEKPNHLAYPNGLFNDNTIDVFDSLNMKFGYTVIGGYNMMADSKKTLKRIGINASDSIYVLVLKLVLYSTLKFGKK